MILGKEISLMDIDSVLSEMRNLIPIGFEKYAPRFRKYERLLQKEVKDNPNNIRAVCMLAMVKFELRKRTSTSLKYLESSYNRLKDSVSDFDFCLLATNTAYFYIEECADKEKFAIELLKAAIKRNSPFAQTYYALALEYYKENQFEYALPLFQKAAEISSFFRYYYNYAICLNKCNQIEQSIKILKVLSCDFDTHEYKAKAYYSLGVLYASLGEIKKVREIATQLLNTAYSDFDIEHDMLADLMFSVGEFQLCLDLYDKEKLWESADWLSIYFYIQKKTNRANDAFKKLSDVIDKISMEIMHCTLDDFDGNKKEFYEYINSEKERIESIKTAYNNIFHDNIKPVATLHTRLIYGCYYIDCPRHRVDEIQNTVI